MAKICRHVLLITGAMFVLPITLHAQAVYWLNQEEPMRYYSARNAEPVAAVDDLPDRISDVVQIAVSERIPSFFRGKLSFRSGFVVDVDAVIADYTAGLRRWVVPAYDLRFTFADSSIGVVNYPVDLRLDQYGQVLEYSIPNIRLDRARTQDFRFVALDDAVQTAIEHAKAEGIGTDSVSYKLKYTHDDRLYWMINMWDGIVSSSSSGFGVDVDVETGEVVDTYEVLSVDTH